MDGEHSGVNVDEDEATSYVVFSGQPVLAGDTAVQNLARKAEENKLDQSCVFG